ncbi:MAG: transcription antitermination factor NusB [Bacteroidota bacterium]
MLNRRILRVKAMQSLYAFHQMKEANREVVRNMLIESYAPDLNANELPDKEALERDKQAALGVFDEFFKKSKNEASEAVEKEIISNVNRHLAKYHTMVSDDVAAAKKHMLLEVDQIFHHYLKLLLLASEFLALDQRDAAKKATNRRRVHTAKNNISKNPYFLAFEDFKTFDLQVIRKNVSWENHRDELKSWYKDLKNNDELFQKYQQLDNPTDDQHFEIINFVLKSMPFKKENVKLFMEGEDLHWSENKTIIKSLINKTIKSYDPESEEKYILMEVNKNEEDDIPFFKFLYSETIDKDEEFEEIIANRAKNWEVDRMATIDKIILKMALTEMINYPGIPTKVSINEYIELSKNYSTPKSKQFINGVLDVLAEDLTKDGVIRKSGRGLIDNK